MANPDAFSQQENDKVQAELASTICDLLDQENETDNDVLYEESSPLPSSTASVFMSGNELYSKIQLLSQKQHKLFNKVQSWAKRYVQNKSRADPLEHEWLLIFLIDDTGCVKFFFMELTHIQILI